MSKPRPDHLKSVKAQSKICAACGKPFTNRKRWQARGQWEQVRFCSERCRHQAKPRPADHPPASPRLSAPDPPPAP